MNKKILKISVFIFAILFGFISCDNVDDPKPMPKGDYENGFFITNEGNFGSPNGSITFIDNELLQESHNIFSSINSTNLGDVLQSVTFEEDYAYLVLNNSNKIEVVNRYTFKSIATITENIAAPRYALVKNGKLYVTNGGNNSVLIFDATSFAYETSITIDKTVEEIKENNDFIYVMNAAYGFGSEISVLDVKTNTVVKTITVAEGLNSIEIEDGILYALHKTGITKVSTSTNEIIGDIPFEDGLSNATKLEVEDDFLYFLSGSKIFKFSKDVTSLANVELVDTKVEDQPWFVGYGFSVVKNKLFYTDVKGFTENSEVQVYDLDGKLLKNFNAGIGANGVYDND